jgi:DNA-directed RNA polymerase specialized sigma24 family protein
MHTALSSLEQDALTETYNDVRLLIYKVTHHFTARSGLPFEELLGESHYIFARAYRNYSSKRGAKFSSFLYFSLHCELKNFIKKQFKHRNLLEVNEEVVGTEDANTFAVGVQSELGADAQAIVQLILETPADIDTLFRWNRVKGKRGVLICLREHLTDIGWSVEQIRDTFSEIQTVLGDTTRRKTQQRTEFWLRHRVGLTPDQVRRATIAAA